MRILVFSWRDPKHPLSGGAEQVMHEHAKGWIAAGHKVTLFSSRSNGLRGREFLDGVKVIREGYQYVGVQLAGFLYYLKNKDKFNLVVDQFHGLPFFTPFYVRKPRLAVIQETARDVWFLNPLPWPLNWLLGTIGYLFEPLIFLFYHTTLFMTGSQSAKRDVVKFGIPAKNITVVPHGVITVKPKPFPKKEKIYTITYLGILAKDKGVEDALQCFSLLGTNGKFQFWVIGKPETQRYMQYLRGVTKKLGISEKVKFWGFVTQKKKFELLARAHVLVNPSVHEGWGLVNIEANTMGTPVVAYRSAGLVDSVRDGESGILCQENIPQKLAEETLLLLADKARYHKLQKSALSWGKEFSWRKSRGKSLALIKQVFDQNK